MSEERRADCFMCRRKTTQEKQPPRIFAKMKCVVWKCVRCGCQYIELARGAT